MMRNWKRVLYGLHPHLLAWIWSALLISEMILAWFVFREPRFPALVAVGWVLWALGVVFAILPIFTLRSRGRVPEGKSYMETTTLVDSGIYAIVRHPQGGTAGILFNPALALIGQHWLLGVLSVVGMALIYIDTFKSDEECVVKFGEEYIRYMQRVPRVNFVAGLWRLLARQGREGTGP